MSTYSTHIFFLFFHCCRFVRQVGTGNVPITLSGSNNLIYAWAKDNTKAFKYHGKSNRYEQQETAHIACTAY